MTYHETESFENIRILDYESSIDIKSGIGASITLTDKQAKFLIKALTKILRRRTK